MAWVVRAESEGIPLAGKKRQYSQHEIERGLLAVAYYGGNAGAAAAALREDNLPIPSRTLTHWTRTSKVEDYERVRKELLPKIGAQAADEHRALAQKQIQLSHRMTDELAARVGEIQPRDLSTAIRNLDVGSGIHTQRATDLQPGLAGRYGNGGAIRDLKGILASLLAKGIEGVMEEESEEVHEAVVVES